MKISTLLNELKSLNDDFVDMDVVIHKTGLLYKIVGLNVNYDSDKSLLIIKIADDTPADLPQS